MAFQSQDHSKVKNWKSWIEKDNYQDYNDKQSIYIEMKVVLKKY